MTKTPNTLFPGRKNYVGPHSGVFAFVHHEVLFESSHNIDERIKYIIYAKPSHEIATRLKNIMYLGPTYSVVVQQHGTDFAAEGVLAYIKQQNPKCAWVRTGVGGNETARDGSLQFPKRRWFHVVLDILFQER